MKVEQRRRLTDLYARGRAVKLVDEDDGFFEEVYLRKMTPPELDEAFARATSARSRLIAAAKDGSDEACESLKKQVSEMSHDDLVGWVVGSEAAAKRAVFEAQVSDREEWTKDRYLIGLQEFVTSTEFAAKKGDTPEDPEVVRVELELARWEAQIDEMIDEEKTTLEAQWDGAPDAKMSDKILDEIWDMKGNSEWLMEYKKSQIWLCTHESENHRHRYFQERDEIDQLQKPIVETLLAEIEQLHVSDAEGKG